MCKESIYMNPEHILLFILILIILILLFHWFTMSKIIKKKIENKNKFISEINKQINENMNRGDSI